MVQLLNRLLVYGGAFTVVLMACYLAADPYTPSLSQIRFRLLIIFLALILNQVGLHNVSLKVFSSRQFHNLREETDRFIDLVRELNTVKLEGDDEQVELITQKMHRCVDRIKGFAGEAGETQNIYQQERAARASR